MGSSARRLTILLALVGGMSGACSTAHETALVQEKVTQFHALLDAGRGSEIYDGASLEFRNASTKPQALAYFDGVRRNLGTVQTTEADTWQWYSMTNGKFINVAYKTQFSGGGAVESFQYRITNGTPVLMRYNITSDVLVTK